MKDFSTLADLEKAEPPGEMPVRLGVIGDPVAHSRSPQMQNAALAHCGLKMRYAPFQIAAGELPQALEKMAARDFLGVNLTIPHKQAAMPLMHELDDFAQRSGAVNGVRFQGGQRFGFNTDGPGFSRAIRSEFSVDLRDLRILLLGVGGAGRAIALQCALEGCERLVLVNRTFDKAQALARELRPFFQEARVLGPVARLEAIAWQEAALRFQMANSDLVIHATSLGMKRADASPVPASLLAPHLMVYDVVYQAARTPLLVAAAEAGARGANGLSMLLHQGALAFEHWFDREAPLEVMRRALL